MGDKSAAGNMARRLEFSDLETEIKAAIVEKVLRPTDLKSLCLVNKQLHELAVKPLYRNVSLDLGSGHDSRLASFLSPKNIGLKHVRQVRLYLANIRDRCNQKRQADFATQMLLEFLPEDVLEEFRWVRTSSDPDLWCPWESFPAESLKLLYSRQRRMKWLEVMSLDRDVLPDLKQNPKLQNDLFSNARKLALYPENRQTLELSRFFVEKTSDRLEELIVHCNFDSPDPRDHAPSPPNVIDPRELNDSATGPGLLTRTVFAGMLPFDRCTPFPKLKSLRLHRISLRYSADTWCQFVNFHDIEQLRIYNCPGADSLLGQLSRANHLPKQLKALEIQHKDNAENECLLALEGFLCLVSGLQDLVIDMENIKTLPNAAGIVRHGKTLELLNVHGSQDCGLLATTTPSGDTDAEELVWNIDEISKICKSCTKLEQLSCAWPQTSLVRSPTTEWKAWENALGYLRDLVTLHISTFPGGRQTHSSSTQSLPRCVYEQLLSGLATSMFDVACTTSNKSSSDSAPAGGDTADPPSVQSDGTQHTTGSPKLRLIAFGISDKIYEREDSRNQLLYLRSTCQDALGKNAIHATPIGWCLRQFIEPRSEVLDFVMHRETLVPCREAVAGGVRGAWGDEDDFEIA
ncbi:hypothetical protein D0860_03091 [Hortaea werneckii]|uniref:Uncharacterized protein n=1 Tax=Hortaea werneckii TaxID=91943 RepID=A0A3M7HGU6_HORWE|nr:hypothetical protein D0860_03091 [Hortaea werneckii]